MALTQIKAAAMAANSIDSDQYVDGSIDNAHLADDAVDSDEIAAGAIDTAHIGDDQVTADKLANAINTDIAAKAPLASPALTGSPTTARLTAGSATTTGFYTVNATTNSTLGSGWSALYARNATAGGRAIGVLNAGATAETVTILENGNATFAGSVTDSKGNLRSLPQNSQAGAYTLVAADAGKHIEAVGTITIPNSVFSEGDMVTIVNNSAGDITLTKTITTMYLASDGTNANRTLASRGMCTILFMGGTEAFISGAGLS